VIFLTTNRLTAFDSAFESRIQLKLFYNALTIEQRESIWKSLIPQSSMATADDQVYNRLAKKYEINGREIKNMIKVAMAIATRGNGGLEEKHFEKVAQMNAEWAKHAKEIGEV
jgi:SpoVK/Ycf46/Vps4 family AAA+-type ATPase